MYDTSFYTDGINTSTTEVLGAFFGVLLVTCLIALAVCIVLLISTVKMFKKANKPWWAAILPIYNIITLLDVIGYNWYYMFLFLVPVVNFVFMLFAYVKLAKAFGKDVGFAFGLLLLPVIFFPIMGFSKDIKYVGPTVNGDIDFNNLM